MVPGVTLTLMCAGTEPRSEVSDEQGRFRFEDVPTGDCSVVADLQGFKPATEGLLVRPRWLHESCGAVPALRGHGVCVAVQSTASRHTWCATTDHACHTRARFERVVGGWMVVPALRIIADRPRLSRTLPHARLQTEWGRADKTAAGRNPRSFRTASLTPVNARVSRLCPVAHERRRHCSDQVRPSITAALIGTEGIVHPDA